jgi:hypothetical protein
MVRDTHAITARESGAALRRVRSGVKEAIANRQTTSELKTNLFHAFDNQSRDWLRVAHTEMNTAIQQGIYGEILEKSGPDQLVFKRPNPDACEHCKRVYLMPDGITPRVFKLSDLEETNVGRRARDWRATIGSVHPWCNCQLQVIPEGFDFKQRKIAVEQFKFEGQTFKRGQIIPENVLSRLGSGNLAKTGTDSILEFTGVTAKPVKKSETSGPISDEDCVCDHI